MTNDSGNPSFEQAVTNLLISVTEIKGDIKLILHQVATSEKVREDHEKRIEILEMQAADSIAERRTIKYFFGLMIALLTVAIGVMGLYFH